MIRVREDGREAQWDFPDPSLLASLPATALDEDVARLYWSGDPELVDQLVRLVGTPSYGAARTHESVQDGAAGKARWFGFEVVSETPAPPGGRFDNVPRPGRSE